MLYVLVAVIALGAWLYALFEVLSTDEADVRSLSKFSWVLLVLLTFWVGAFLWLLFGRPRGGLPRERGRRGRRGPQPLAPRGPDDDPDFLQHLDRRLRGDD